MTKSSPMSTRLAEQAIGAATAKRPSSNGTAVVEPKVVTINLSGCACMHVHMHACAQAHTSYSNHMLCFELCFAKL